jgi:hypothetical protein
MEKKESNNTDLIPDGLDETKPAVQEEYYRLLLDMQIESVKKSGGSPEIITVEQRKKLLDQAQTNVSMGHIDPEKMERDWENATSKDGRPPIGGAQDD